MKYLLAKKDNPFMLKGEKDEIEHEEYEMDGILYYFLATKDGRIYRLDADIPYFNEYFEIIEEDEAPKMGDLRGGEFTEEQFDGEKWIPLISGETAMIISKLDNIISHLNK